MPYKIPITKPFINEAIEQAVLTTLRSRHLTEGSITAQLESRIADLTGYKFGIAVCNATVGLELVLRAKYGRGRKVGVSAFTHPATYHAILNADCAPYPIDVNPKTFLISPSEDIETTCDLLMPTSIFGYPLHYAYTTNLPEIEDAACSLSSRIYCQEAVISFHPRKLITTGEGGMILTSDSDLAIELREMKNFGRGNYKLSDLQASVALAQLDFLQEIIDSRKITYMKYTRFAEALGFCVLKAPLLHDSNIWNYQSCVLTTQDKPHLKLALTELARHFGIEITEACSSIFNDKRLMKEVPQLQNESDFPVARELYKNSFSLPL